MIEGGLRLGRSTKTILVVDDDPEMHLFLKRLLRDNGFGTIHAVSGSEGLHLTQGKAAMESVKVVRRGPQQSLVEITLREGRNRQIRVMLARLGHSVRRLTRVRMGQLTLSGLGPGKVRELTSAEVTKLRSLAHTGGDLSSRRGAASKRKTPARAGKKKSR